MVGVDILTLCFAETNRKRTLVRHVRFVAPNTKYRPSEMPRTTVEIGARMNHGDMSVIDVDIAGKRYHEKMKKRFRRYDITPVFDTFIIVGY